MNIVKHKEKFKFKNGALFKLSTQNGRTQQEGAFVEGTIRPYYRLCAGGAREGKLQGPTKFIPFTDEL